mmetsp:Transcript_152078/g.485913  ORF Transcript_152078/g.485913 Transcript_152078/m.485913 type:complete len:253 (-) Transcript_152078:838-1596(-)
MNSSPSSGDWSMITGSNNPKMSSMTKTPSATLMPMSSEWRDAMFCMLLLFFMCRRHAAIMRFRTLSSSSTISLKSWASTSLTSVAARSLPVAGLSGVIGSEAPPSVLIAAIDRNDLCDNVRRFSSSLSALSFTRQFSAASREIYPSMSSSKKAKIWFNFLDNIFSDSTSFSFLPKRAAILGMRAATRTMRVRRLRRVAFVEREAKRTIRAIFDDRPAANALPGPSRTAWTKYVSGSKEMQDTMSSQKYALQM